MKRSHLRPLAERDLVERTRYYNESAGTEVANRFFDAAIQALRSVEAMPGIGSPTVADLIGVEGFRRIEVEGFPCSWFYLERSEGLDVVRLLADRQDIATLLGDTD